MENFNISVGSNVHIRVHDGGGRSGIVSSITKRGVYLDVGNKRPVFFNFKDIDGISQYD